MPPWLRRFHAEIYYDAWCPLCMGAKRRVERLDWIGLIRFASIREAGAVESLGVTSAQLEQRMHARTGSGRVVDGVEAVAAIAARVPLLMPLWPALVFAGWIGLGQRVYDLVASRRTIVPVGTCGSDTCQVHQGARRGPSAPDKTGTRGDTEAP